MVLNNIGALTKIQSGEPAQFRRRAGGDLFQQLGERMVDAGKGQHQHDFLLRLEAVQPVTQTGAGDGAEELPGPVPEDRARPREADCAPRHLKA